MYALAAVIALWPYFFLGGSSVAESSGETGRSVSIEWTKERCLERKGRYGGKSDADA